MNWLFLAVLTAVFYGTYNVLIKVSSAYINQIVGAVILQIVAALVGGLILIGLKIMNSPLEITTKGITYAIMAGVMVGFAEISSFYLFAKGISASVGIPVIIGGSIVAGAVLGQFVLKETIGLTQYIAITLILIGVVLITSKS